MELYQRKTPEGTSDYMFRQCNVRRKISDCLTGLYHSRGYGEVKTPTLEYYSLFHDTKAYFPEEEMYKLSDRNGRLMVIRPDCTVPIARLAATRLQNVAKPLRLYYNQTVLRANPDLRGRSNEMVQVGVEVMGVSNRGSDLEIIETAAHSLELVCKECGLSKEFRVEICHIGYFRELIKALDASPFEQEKIRRYIEYKNYAMLNDALSIYEEKTGLPREAAYALKLLPQLFGDKDVIRQAKELFGQPEAVSVLDYLEGLYDSLESLGLSGKIIVDLGLVNQADYYTGVIFRGYLHGTGFEVLSGGRYDTLTEDFGLTLPATGFAVYVDRIAKQVLEEEPIQWETHSDILIHAQNQGTMVEALKYRETQEQSGKICEMSLFQSREDAIQYANTKGIREIHWIGEQIEVQQMG